jgi:transglutaminase-like putative cysteine protease
VNDAEAVRYHVLHETRYRYRHPVGLSRQLLRLEPRALPYQRLLRHDLFVTPTPELLETREDAFGNPLKSLCIEADHDALVVRAASWVEVSPRRWPDDEATPPWEAVAARVAYHAGQGLSDEELEATRVLFESTRVRNKRELAAWARVCFPAGAPLLRCVRALMTRIHQEFTFDPQATTVSTPVMEVFAKRRGVCQDFAHLMLSCLRSLALPARYVSGYLLTHPRPGEPRLVGADASHAWVSVYCPGFGWIDVDPTNAVLPSQEHVTLGWGRDFDDVSPLRGVLLGGGEHELDIAVTVVPEAEYEALLGSAAR